MTSAWQSRILKGKSAPLWLSALVAAVLVGAMIGLREVQTMSRLLPIGYGVPIIVIGVFRDRRLLWLSYAVFVAFIVGREVFQDQTAAESALILFDLSLVTIVVDFWIVSAKSLGKRNVDLEAANADLAAREEEIARQNEELQSQTEELERQSEELRVANDDLAQREKFLEMLLSLSRSLNTEMSRDDIMTRICQTLGLLIEGPDTAAGIIERHGDQMRVVCHHGFGPQGLRETSIPAERSFAALVLAKDRTGYIEDIAARPDLRIPQPKEGEPMVAILATPLRVRGRVMGSLEVYSRRHTTWNHEQVGLVESLAAQTAVSLEAADLFETIVRERNRFEAVLRAAPVGILVCDGDCDDIRVNPAGAALLNVPSDQIITSASLPATWRGMKQDKTATVSEHPLVRAARDGVEIYAEEVEVLLVSGRRIICLVYARPNRRADGKIDGAVAVFADITAQKELQRELDTRRREAEEASVRKTRFLAAVSHDVRTPANAISLLAELIRRTCANPAMAGEVPELAQELHASAVSLVNLLTDVLDIARFDSDKVELHETEFLLASLLSDEHKQLLPLAREKNLSLEFEATPDTLMIRTDRIKLARVLGNLIGNAIKFTEAGGVRINSHRNGDNTIQIIVSDTGIGIPAESMSHIFDEFFQLRNSERDRTKGSGLGLTICKRLADAMGGRIDVKSTPGHGSMFTLTLPAFATLPSK